MRKNIAFALAAGLITQMAVSVEGSVQYPKQYPANIGWKNMVTEGADPTGQVDATEKIRAVIGAFRAGYAVPLIIYFPAGTYLISNMIDFQQNECNVTFRGQGPDASIIKLQDNAQGFSTSKAVFMTKSGNAQFKNSFYDLGINTGRGNPGAIGIDYIASNRGAIENVKIVSGDGNGEAGIAMTRGWPGPCLLRNVTVEGFNHGIRVGCWEYGPTFENITLRNQKVYGFFNAGNSVAIRNLVSVNTVPALRTEGAGLAIVLGGNINSDISIDTESYLYHRGVTIRGVLQGEVTSRAPVSLFSTTGKALALEIKETPEFHDNNLDNWFDARDLDDATAWTSGLQYLHDGMNSGKSTLYFPMGRYGIKGTLRIPPTLRKIHSFESFLNSSHDGFKRYNRYYGGDVCTILVELGTESDPPLIIENFDAGFVLHHTSKRDVVIKNSNDVHYVNGPGSGDLFLSDVIMHYDMKYPQRVWARQWNSETLYGAADRIINRGGDLWILGLKTEGAGAVINTLNGGRTEMYGTLLYPVVQFSEAQRKEPAFRIHESCATLIFSQSSYGANTYYRLMVEETRGGVTKKAGTSADGYQSLMAGRVMPLYIANNDQGCPNPPMSARRDGIAPSVKPTAKAASSRRIMRYSRASVVTVPAGVRGFQVFSASGALLWTCEQAPSAGETRVTLPRRVAGQGMSVIRMLQD